MQNRKQNMPKTFFLSCLVILLMSTSQVAQATPYSTTSSADRAVEIARHSRDRVERNGKGLKASSQVLFKEFAEQTVALQKLIDTRESLEEAGFLTKGDPAGDARRAHINGKILLEVGELKKACDNHLTGLLYSLEAFDTAVAASLVDSQATRSINSNYELALSHYLKQEKGHFDQASTDAQKSLEAYQNATDPRVKNRRLKKYNRAKKRLVQIDQRRKLYEARINTAAMNQQISGLLREKIREEGNSISPKFRQVMADLYTAFAKITPIAEIGGTGSPEIMANLGFPNIEALRGTLDIVEGSIGKLSDVLDDMVNDVLTGLGEIKVVKGNGLTEQSFSFEEEMDFLRKQREAWNS